MVAAASKPELAPLPAEAPPSKLPKNPPPLLLLLLLALLLLSGFGAPKVETFTPPAPLGFSLPPRMAMPHLRAMLLKTWLTPPSWLEVLAFSFGGGGGS
jgi:hypothetical protein